MAAKSKRPIPFDAAIPWRKRFRWRSIIRWHGRHPQLVANRPGKAKRLRDMRD